VRHHEAGVVAAEQLRGAGDLSWLRGRRTVEEFSTLLGLADGQSRVTETIFENRFMHVAELARMGARIETDGAIAIVAGLVATALASVVAYLAAAATYRFGLDPDNHGIPIVTSAMDFLGAAALVAVIALFGVTPHG